MRLLYGILAKVRQGTLEITTSTRWRRLVLRMFYMMQATATAAMVELMMHGPHARTLRLREHLLARRTALRASSSSASSGAAPARGWMSAWDRVGERRRHQLCTHDFPVINSESDQARWRTCDRCGYRLWYYNKTTMAEENPPPQPLRTTPWRPRHGPYPDPDPPSHLESDPSPT